MLISISESILKEIAYAIKDEGGREVCGFLVRSPEGTLYFWRVKNLTISKGSFSLNPIDVERIYRQANKQQFIVAAFVHSHDSGLSLSAEDKLGIASSNLPWVIVCVYGTDITYKVY